MSLKFAFKKLMHLFIFTGNSYLVSSHLLLCVKLCRISNLNDCLFLQHFYSKTQGNSHARSPWTVQFVSASMF